MCRKQSVQPEIEYRRIIVLCLYCLLTTDSCLFIYLFLAEITFCIEVSFHCSNIYRTKVHITLCMLFYMNLSTAEFPKDTDWNLIKIWLKSARCYNQNASVWTSSERIELELVMYRRTDIISTKTRTVQTKPILGFTLIAKTAVLIT